jgi:hypothetical protein
MNITSGLVNQIHLGCSCLLYIGCKHCCEYYTVGAKGFDSKHLQQVFEQNLALMNNVIELSSNV